MEERCENHRTAIVTAFRLDSWDIERGGDGEKLRKRPAFRKEDMIDEGRDGSEG